jgi:hypothetical protein
MMGDFAGNAGFLSVWFDEETWSWEFEFSNCRLGKQHFWWIVHVLDIITGVVLVVYTVLLAVSSAIDKAIQTFSAKFQPTLRTAGMNPITTSRDDTSSLLKGTIFEVPKKNAALQVPGVDKKVVRKRKSKQQLVVTNKD